MSLFKNLLPHTATLWKYAHSAISDCLLLLKKNEGDEIRGCVLESIKKDLPTTVHFIHGICRERGKERKSFFH